MTDRDRDTVPPDAFPSGSRPPGTPRSALTIAYVAATVLGGVGALVMVLMVATAPDASALDLLVWSALALLLFASAAYRWWRGGHAEERSRRVAGVIGSEHVASAAEGSGSEVETVRRLRRAHPGLSLRDAVGLVRRHGSASERTPDR